MRHEHYMAYSWLLNLRLSCHPRAAFGLRIDLDFRLITLGSRSTVCLVIRATATNGRARAILKSMFTTTTTVAQQPVTKRCACAVQSDRKGPGGNTQIFRNGLTALILQIDAAYQVAGIRWKC